MPCADMEVSSLANSKMAHSKDNDNHSHNTDNDLCSPFCSCNCCGSQIGSYFKVLTINSVEVSKSIKTQLPTYTSKFASNFYGSIWQPPQIV